MSTRVCLITKYKVAVCYNVLTHLNTVVGHRLKYR